MLWHGAQGPRLAARGGRSSGDCSENCGTWSKSFSCNTILGFDLEMGLEAARNPLGKFPVQSPGMRVSMELGLLSPVARCPEGPRLAIGVGHLSGIVSKVP